MKLQPKIEYIFKKGEIIHLDYFLDVCAYVQTKERVKPHKSQKIRFNYDEETTDEFEVLKDFKITILIEE